MKWLHDKRTRRIGLVVALGILFCVMLSLSVSANDATGIKGRACYTYGDLNGDGKVTSKDALLILYHELEPEEYPIDQDCDFEKDEKINSQDAIHLLYSINGLFAEVLPEYALKGVIHAYDEPNWVWTQEANGEYTAKAAYQCACGEMSEVVPAEVTVDAENSVSATCTGSGKAVYKASASYAEVTYGTTYEITEQPLGHSYAEELSCRDRVCLTEGCGYVEKGSGHNFDEPSITPATCTEAAVHAFVCQEEGCGYSYEEEVGQPLGHQLDENTLAEVPVDEAHCQYRQKYTCTNCNGTVEGETIYKHTYKAAVTKEVSCQADGEKTLTCTNCQASKTEPIPHTDSDHHWNNGNDDETIITYECTLCSVTKTSAKANTEQGISQTTLQNVSELSANGATIKMDDSTKAQISEENGSVIVSVTQKDKNELELDSDKLEQIGNNPVYDFNLKVDQKEISNFAGEVTVSLPYTLQDGDDPDCIQVWYIRSTGELEDIEGVYSNGYVTFTTTHFSYYTVTRLTPEERCEKHGHSDTVHTVEKTCTTEGYDLYICSRCARTEKKNIVPSDGHAYEREEVKAGCETDGSLTLTCNKCQYSVTNKIPKTGHTWNENSRTEATCTEAGAIYYGCESASCEASRTETVPAKGHVEEEKEKVAPTCESKGYTSYACTVCDHEEKRNYSNAIGHHYSASWDWKVEDGNITAIVTLACEHDASHVVEKESAIDISKQVDSTCLKDGMTIYQATLTYNRISYSDDYLVTEAAYNHLAGNVWEYNAKLHYHLCTFCDEKLDMAAHKFVEEQVITEATCVESGEVTFVCECGYQENQTTNPIGHDYREGVCTRCEARSEECTHEPIHEFVIEFTEVDGVCGATLNYNACECGEMIVVNAIDAACDFSYFNNYTVDEDGFVINENKQVCKVCQMELWDKWYWEVDEDCNGEIISEYSFYNKDGVDLLGRTLIANEMYTEIHPICKEEACGDLSEYGMCGGTLYKTSCVCGLVYRYEVGASENGASCEWQLDPSSTEDVMLQTCKICGTVAKKETLAEIEEECMVQCPSRITYLKNDNVLFVQDSNYIYQNHQVEMEYELDGTDCSDGYLIKEICRKCGKDMSYYVKPEEGEHRYYIEERIALPEGSCGGEFIISRCPCGKDSAVEIETWESACNWYWDTTEKITENGFIETEIQQCDRCGLRKETIDSFIQSTELPCNYVGTRTQQVIFEETVLGEANSTVYRHSDEYSDIETQLNGATCMEGVKVHQYCNACGLEDTQISYGHEMYVKEAYNLADYGMCGGKVNVEECACGENGWIETVETEDSCQWLFWKWDEITQTSIYRCADCGMFYHESYSETETDSCAVHYTETYEYLKGYNVVLSIEREWDTTNHDYEYSFTFHGENGNCLDGYTVNASCRDCQATDFRYVGAFEADHDIYLLNYYDLSEYGFCGGHISLQGCPCGEERHSSFDMDACDWEFYEYDLETNTEWRVCSTCGQYRSVSIDRAWGDACNQYEERTNKFYDADRQELLSVTYTEYFATHKYSYQFDLDGEKCSDGYTVHETCTQCGESSIRYEKPPEGEHPTYQSKSFETSDYGFCGGEIWSYECACGEEKTYGEDLYRCCMWQHDHYDEETDTVYFKCPDCGGTYSRASVYKETKDCKEYWSYNFVFYDADMNVKFADTFDWTSEKHQYVITFDREVEDCSQGYGVTQRCSTCGYTLSNYSQPPEGAHPSYEMERYDLSEYGFCDTEIIRSECACGKESGYNRNGRCAFEYVSTDANGVDTYRCSVCEGYYTESRREEKIDACHVTQYTSYSYYSPNGEKILTYEDSWENEPHEYVYTFEMLGETCEEGYRLIGTCANCHLTNRVEDYYYEHQNWTVEYIDLEQKGISCGGNIRRFSCACGQEQDVSFNEKCQWGEPDYGLDNTYEQTCQACETVKSVESRSEIINDCLTKVLQTITYTKAGNELLALENDSVQNNHYMRYTLELKQEGSTCSDGYYAYGRCMRCGETCVEEYSGWDGHRLFIVSVQDLAEENMCAGDVYMNRCACGENQAEKYINTSCNWEYFENNEAGNQVEKCSVCGATKEYQHIYTEKDENCQYISGSVYRYRNAAGELVHEESNIYPYYDHDYILHDKVMTGVSCMEGVTASVECRDCHYIATEEYAYHHSFRNIIDLTTYGACAEAKIYHDFCACKEVQGMYYHAPECIMSFSSETEEIDGVEYEIRVNRCETCGLCISERSYEEINEATGERITYCTATITVNNTAVDAIQYQRRDFLADNAGTGSTQ